MRAPALATTKFLVLWAQGGMGKVYRAKDLKIDRKVAIKVLPKDLARHPEARERFEREAKFVAALSHPNILTIFEFGSEGDIHFAVTELLEEQTSRTIYHARASSIQTRSWPRQSPPHRTGPRVHRLAGQISRSRRPGALHGFWRNRINGCPHDRTRRIARRFRANYSGFEYSG